MGIAPGQNFYRFGALGIFNLEGMRQDAQEKHAESKRLRWSPTNSISRASYQVPFCRFVIRLASGTRIHVNEPGQLGPFDDEKV